MTQIIRRGEKALLSVSHPILGTELAIDAKTIRLGPEQYLALVDCLCNLVFLAPHLASAVTDLAAELELSEVSQYVRWMREADQNRAWKEAA